MPKPQRTITEVVRDIMAALPDVEEFLSPGCHWLRQCSS
jgi:hypothetical protein